MNKFISKVENKINKSKKHGPEEQTDEIEEKPEKEQWGDPEPEENSHLAKIDIRPHHNTPFVLYLEWLKEAHKAGMSPFQTSCFALATVSRAGEIGNRMISMKEFRNNMFIFTISEFSTSYKHLKQTRTASMLFFFQYCHYKSYVIRQIKVEGKVKRMCSGLAELYHDQEPLHSKVMYEICNSGEMVDWQTLKKQHDRTVVKYRCGQNELKMPDIYVGYALIPHKIEFWHAEEGYIADRVVFEKNCDCGWSIRRIMA